MSLILNKITAILVLLFLPLLMTVKNGGAAVLVALLIVSLIGLSFNKNTYPLKLTENFFIIAVILYVAVYGFNVFYFDSRLSEFDNTSRFILFLPIYFYLRKTQIHPGFFIYGVLLGASACFLISVYQAFFLSFPRVYGVTSIVSFGGMSMTLGLMSMIIAIISKIWSVRILFFIGFLFGATASILSLSRGAWLTVVSCLIILSIINPKKWSLKIRLIGIVVCLLLLVPLLYLISPVETRINSAIAEVHEFIVDKNIKSSVGVRLEAWRIALQGFRENPLFGIGEGNTRDFIESKADQGETDPYVLILNHVHNEFLSAALHRGIPGLVSLVFLFITPFLVALYRLKFASDETRMILWSGIVFLTSISTMGLSDIYFQQHQPTILYVFLVYFIVAYTSRLEISAVE